MESLPLWEEICYSRSDPIRLLDLSRDDNSDVREIAIPNDSDAFVFYFTSIQNSVKIYEPFKRLSSGEIEWDKGCCQSIYFLTRPESTKIRIEFKGVDFTVCDE